MPGRWLNGIAWSPDGTYLAALVGDDDQSSRIELVHPDGSFAAELVSERSEISSPRWSADSRHVYYLQKSYGLSQLWRVSVDSLQRELLESTLEAGSRFDVAGDGSIVYTHFSTSVSRSPVWSPDGSRIAFVSTDSGAPRIFLMNRDGSNLHSLDVSELSGNLDIEWAPGSELLAQDADVRNYRIIDPDTGTESPLITTAPRGFTVGAIASPGKTEVAALRNAGVLGIWILPLQGPERDARYIAGSDPLPASFEQTRDISGNGGSRVRLSARVRVERTDQHFATLWLRLSRADGTVAYLDDMFDRPILSNEWKTYQLQAAIPDDATSVTFGGISRGFGKSWFDDFRLELSSAGGSWTPLPIRNAGFGEDEAGGESTAWRMDRHDIVLDDTDNANRVVHYDGTGGESRFEFESVVPVGWSRDGSSVIAWDASSSSLIEIPADSAEPGASTIYSIEPFGAATPQPGRVFADGSRYVYSQSQYQSDVWLRYVP